MRLIWRFFNGLTTIKGTFIFQGALLEFHIKEFHIKEFHIKKPP